MLSFVQKLAAFDSGSDKPVMFHMKMGSMGLLLLEGLSSRLSSEGDKLL